MENETMIKDILEVIISILVGLSAINSGEILAGSILIVIGLVIVFIEDDLRNYLLNHLSSLKLFIVKNGEILLLIIILNIPQIVSVLPFLDKFMEIKSGKSNNQDNHKIEILKGAKADRDINQTIIKDCTINIKNEK